jgi:aminoglycoside 6'-N-acetyltransferase
MHRWLNTPHVAQWYYVRGVPNPSPEWVRERYLPRIRGEDPTRAFVIVLAGRPVGYIQAYLIDNHPEYAAAVQVLPGTAGIDMFIGEEDAVHRRHGSRIIGRFLDDIVFGEMAAARALLGPEPGNRIAIRAYEKAGFRHLKTVDIPGGDAEREYLMVLERP